MVPDSVYIVPDKPLARIPSRDGKSRDSIGFDEWLPGLWEWTHYQEIQSVMDTVPEQIDQLHQLQAEVRSRFLELIKGIEYCDTHGFERAMKLFETEAETCRKRLDRIILVSQRRSLAQFKWLRCVQREGWYMPDIFLKAPGVQLTDEQTDRVRANAGQMREWLRRELLDLERKAVERMLDGVPGEQKREVLGMLEVLPKEREPDFRPFFRNFPENCPN